MLDEGDEAPAAAARTITTYNIKVTEVRIVGGGREFGFLKTSDDDVVVGKKVAEFSESGADAVTVELENGSGGRRARVGVNAGDEEEEKDESTGHCQTDEE